MKYYLFEVTDPAASNWGEQFIVGAASLMEARDTACCEMGGPCRFITELTEEETKASILDEYYFI